MKIEVGVAVLQYDGVSGVRIQQANLVNITEKLYRVPHSFSIIAIFKTSNAC